MRINAENPLSLPAVYAHSNCSVYNISHSNMCFAYVVLNAKAEASAIECTAQNSYPPPLNYCDNCPHSAHQGMRPWPVSFFHWGLSVASVTVESSVRG